MGHFLFGPLQEQRALLLEKGLEGFGAEGLDQAGFLLADDIEIHQRQIDLLKFEFAAHQPAVDLRLCPVQLAVIGRLLTQVATVGFDFFQAGLRRVVAVRPALDLQLQKLAFEHHFALILFAAPRGHSAVAGDAFQRRGRWGEAQVEVAGLGGELAQCAHGNAVAQAPCSAHCT
ncbi:hypothetical protein D3C81_1358850 [compost metagenome]